MDQVKKSTVIELFGNRRVLASYLEVGAPAITQWPDVLTDKHIGRCAGAYARFRIDRDKEIELHDETALEIFGV